MEKTLMPYESFLNASRQSEATWILTKENPEWLTRRRENTMRAAFKFRNGFVRPINPGILQCQICFRVTILEADHQKGSFTGRGWLCDSCNKGLGFFKDSPALLSFAIQYLEKTKCRI